MQYTLSTVSALVAALSLTSAAPLSSYSNSNSTSASTSSYAASSSSSASRSGSSSDVQEVIILRQLKGFDAASTITAQLDATTLNNGDVKAASLRTTGPWCAGFSDAEATKPVPALNGDGIFNSVNEAVYSEDDNVAVPVGSWWCAATRAEVEDFVARAIGGNKGGDKEDNKNENNNGGNNNGGDADLTVRIEIEQEAGTTFTQEEVPANVGKIDASQQRGLGKPIVAVRVVGEGECAFFDAQGNNLDFSSRNDGTVTVASLVCEI